VSTGVLTPASCSLIDAEGSWTGTTATSRFGEEAQPAPSAIALTRSLAHLPLHGTRASTPSSSMPRSRRHDDREPRRGRGSVLDGGSSGLRWCAARPTRRPRGAESIGVVVVRRDTVKVDMARARRERILAAFSTSSGGGMSSTVLCQVSTEIVGLTGSGVMLMSGDDPRGSLGATDEVSRLIEDLQFALGEGPCVDAHESAQAVSEPDLADPTLPRWLAFSPPVVEAGGRAVFAFPLRVGSIGLGVLDFYRDKPGPLTTGQHADALVLADVVAHWILQIQADASPGVVARELEEGADFHFALHNAAGMTSVQLDVTVTEALVRLRAYAFATGRPLGDVARDVVARELRLE
jgi:hypothetical protein